MTICIFYKKYEGMILEIYDDDVTMVKEAFPEHEVYFASTYDDFIEKGIKADILLLTYYDASLYPNEATFEEYVEFSGNIKWIHYLFTGVDHLLASPVFAENDILLTNSSGVHALPISEQVLGFMLAFARAFPIAFVNKLENKWERPAVPFPDELNGKTLGIIGLGKIGKEIVKRAKPFNMRILGYKRVPEEIEYVDKLYFGDELKTMLSESDYIVLLLPGTAETDKIIDAECFAAMKPSAYFINIGRGMCVDNDALISALRNGLIAGAAIDAYDPEPMPKDCPLWDMDNVIITAHIGGDCPKTLNRAIQVFVDNMPHYLDGTQMKNVVDQTKGY